MCGKGHLADSDDNSAIFLPDFRRHRGGERRRVLSSRRGMSGAMDGFSPVSR
jgi:hypothetical protein